MKKLEYQVSFATPAFLGNAHQLAQWRTPPFKALIRHWWRILKAREVAYEHHKLRHLEGTLFGNAWLEGDFRKSQVRLRLSSWDQGKFLSPDWPGGPIDKVITTQDGKGTVRSDLYLGYGPVTPPSKKTGQFGIGIRGAVKPTETARLQILCPSASAEEIQQTCELIGRFGALGSRSRNGWGSLLLTPVGQSDMNSSESALRLRSLALSLDQCLERDWPHAIGADSHGPLIWRTAPCQDWRQVVGKLANVRVGVRRMAKQLRGPNIAGVHLLGYPAGGKWQLPVWAGNGPDEPEGRLASSLRFKVINDTNDECYGIVAHLPTRLPDDLAKRLDPSARRWVSQNEIKVWQAVHRVLDSEMKLDRMEG